MVSIETHEPDIGGVRPGAGDQGDLPGSSGRTEGNSGGSRGMVLALAVAVAGVFGYVVWQSNAIHDELSEFAGTPLIPAQAGEARVRPDDPGGMEVPHREIEILNDPGQTSGESEAVVLLPPPEQPLDRPAAETAVSGQSGPVVEAVPTPPPVTVESLADKPLAAAAVPPPPSVAKAAPVPAEVPRVVAEASDVPPPPAPSPEAAPPAAPAAPSPEAPPPATATQAAPSAVPVAVPGPPPPAPDTSVPEASATDMPPPVEKVPTAVPAPAPPQPAAPPPAEVVADSGVRIQLAAFRDAAAAEQAWQAARTKSGTILGDLKPEIVRADLGAEKGVYFRLRAGPFASRGAASDTCNALKDSGVDCIVVK